MMAELDGRGIAAMLAADAHFQVGASGPSLVDGHLHQPPHAIHIDGLEWVLGKDACLHVGQQEAGLRVIAAVTEGHLGEVVGAEGEEFGDLRDLGRGQGRTRDLDHGSELVLELDALLRHDLLGDALQARLDDLELVYMANQRNHHLGLHSHALQGLIGRSLKDGSHLHLHDLGHDNAQTHAAHAHHGVTFV